MSQVSKKEWAGFLAMVLGMFMAILDIQIVASSLPQIQAGLNASASEISWVQTAYLIAEVVMIPLSGWLTRVASTRLLFAASAFTFTIASAFCAMAWDIESMIFFRAIQGFMGGAMIPLVFSSSMRIFPFSQRTGVTVLIGLIATMAPTLGPTLGGWLTERFSWHWLFLVNLLPGALVTTMTLALVKIDEPDWKLLRTVDIPGIIFMGVFLGSLQYVLEEGPGEDWLESRKITFWGSLTLIGAFLFFWRELIIANPVVDLRAFKNANFSTGCIFSFVIGIGLYGSVYLLPLFLGRIKGYNSLEIGITMIVTGAFQFLSAPLAGILSKKIDLRLMLACGLTLFGVGLWLTGLATHDWGYWELFLPQAVRGLSLMLCFVPINNLALGTLPKHEIHNASGLYNLTRNLGGAIGLALINTLLAKRYDIHFAHLSENITAAKTDSILNQLPLFLDKLPNPDTAALKIISLITQREAMVLTFNDAFMATAAVFFAALILMPKVQKVIPENTP